MIMKDILLLILHTILWRCVRTQIPSIQCPQLFEYVRLGSTFVGKISLPNVVPGTTTVYVEFSQREKIFKPNYYGNLALYDDRQTTINKIYSGKPLIYRIDFPTPNVIPKLTLIKVNNVVLCFDMGYPPPSTVLRLSHTLSASDLGASLVSYKTPPNQVSNFIVPTSQSRMSSIPQTASNSFEQTTSTTNVINTAECGIENRVITPYIVGGEQLSPGQFPWLTAIFANTGTNLQFLCGGTLVSARTVITAAHCFQNGLVAAIVHLGHYDLEDNKENFQTRNVQQLIKHPEFRSVNLPDADIAILHLDAAVSFSVSIRPACLWNDKVDANLLVGQIAAVAGWGENELRQLQSKPKKANANIVSTSECQSALSNNLVSATARAICVRSSGGSTPCRGDSGGGLVVLYNGRWTLRAIVSGGFSNSRGCLLDYTFFCDLAQHSTWLVRNII